MEIDLEKIHTWVDKDGVTCSSDYCTMPSEIDSENMFCGSQNYATVCYLLGITKGEDSWRHEITYDNEIFKGTLAFESSPIYSSILTYARIDGKEYYSCNGICDPERSTEILDIYKAVENMFPEKYVLGEYSFHAYMFKTIYGR